MHPLGSRPGRWYPVLASRVEGGSVEFHSDSGSVRWIASAGSASGVEGAVFPWPGDAAAYAEAGAAPGARSGTVLIAGHVDSKAQGPGAFFRLKDARVGDRITVTSRSGATRTFRVVSVRTMPKPQLPTDIYSTKGRHRLALVTCGGPFNEAIGHYRDNVVVIAVPV